MKRWRSVGTMAFLVTCMTASEISASSTDTGQTREWLRTSAKPAKSVPQPSDASIGKWMALALVVGLGGFLLWKRRSVSGKPFPTTVSKIRISAATRISAKAQIIAVEIQGRTLLIGATDSNITRLGWLDVECDNDVEDVGGEDAPSPTYDRPRSASAGSTATKSTNSVSRSVPQAAISIRPDDTRPRKSSRFRELLADAIGLPPRRGPKAKAVHSAPVDELLISTQDRYIGSDTGPENTPRLRREPAKAANLINVEGQAKGLVARLNRPPQ